jgi:hypothetical protein
LALVLQVTAPEDERLHKREWLKFLQKLLTMKVKEMLSFVQ